MHSELSLRVIWGFFSSLQYYVQVLEITQFVKLTCAKLICNSFPPPPPPTQTIHSNSKLPLPFALANTSFNTSYNTYFHRVQLWRDWLLRKPHRTSKWHVFKDTYPILILQPLGKRHASSFHRESRSYQGCTRIPRHPAKQEKKI